MKKTFLVIALLVAASVTIAYQVEKTASVKLTEAEWVTIINIIDDSKTYGDVRKPLIQKITEQAAPQLYPAKADSTKKKQ